MRRARRARPEVMKKLGRVERRWSCCSWTSRSHFNLLLCLPVLNPRTILNHGFDTYKLMPAHNDMRAMVRKMKFTEERPSFYLLNVGETHYAYALPGEPPEEWPRISGVHGVFKHPDEQVGGGKLVARGEITSDHAELFGEGGYFGHGPIQHDKVFEVFLVEGKLR